MTTLWYRWSDLPPPTTVMTWWLWDGREFVGIRRARREGEPVLIDAKTGQRVKLAGTPQLWRPLKPEHWKSPLPDPVATTQSSIMYTERQRFGCVEDAEASDLARENDQLKDVAQATREQDVFHGKPSGGETRWWRDVTSIRYEGKGAIDRKMAEGRMLRALAWCGAGSGLKLPDSSLSAVLAKVSAAAEEASADAPEAFVPRFQPLPQDRTDFDVAMSWYVALNPVELWPKRRDAWSLSRIQKVLLWRSLDVPLSFADISHELRWKGHARAVQVYNDALDKVWRAANGRRVFTHLTVTDQIAALRQRNKAARGVRAA